MGSSPIVGLPPRYLTRLLGSVSRAAKGADCKSAGGSLRRFESCPAHSANLFDAHIAQLVEHALGKGEVMGSSPIVGFFNASRAMQYRAYP